jgi:hypothetical protein
MLPISIHTTATPNINQEAPEVSSRLGMALQSLSNKGHSPLRLDNNQLTTELSKSNSIAQEDASSYSSIVKDRISIKDALGAARNSLDNSSYLMQLTKSTPTVAAQSAMAINPAAQHISDDVSPDTAEDLLMERDAAAATPHHECSIDRMQRILSNELFATKINSLDSISENDILVRTASNKAFLNQQHHNDLLVHSSILIVKNITGDNFTFNRIEMVEAGRRKNVVGHNEKYSMGLNFSAKIDTKPNDFLMHGDTYKIHLPSTGQKLRSDRLNTFSRFAHGLSLEESMLKSAPQTYGSGSDDLYNCNTFVANVLSRACGLSIPTQPGQLENVGV